MSMKSRYGDWALITGGSSGIGLELAKYISGEGINLILVARDMERLEKAKTDIKRDYNVAVEIISLDLTSDSDIDQLIKLTSQFEIGLLVLCAGKETVGEFVTNSLEDNRSLVKLNVQAPMTLAHVYGKLMVGRKKGGIIFVSSSMGYQGIPYVANYSASKSYILLLGEALNIELGKYGIDVTVVSPGMTTTPMTENMAIDFSKMPVIPMNPSQVAHVAIKSLGNKSTVVTGFLNKIYAWQNRLVSRKMATKLFGMLIHRSIKISKRSDLLAK